MIFCPRCGMQVEETVSFCPNCGMTIPPQSQLTQSTISPSTSVRPVTSVKNEEAATRLNQSVKAGVYGSFLALIINLIAPIYLYSIPPFVTSILVVYLYSLKTLKDGLVSTFITYMFNDAILSMIGLASVYLANETYTVSADIWVVLYPIINAISALIAAYIGVRLVQGMKLTKSVEA